MGKDLGTSYPNSSVSSQDSQQFVAQAVRVTIVFVAAVSSLGIDGCGVKVPILPRGYVGTDACLGCHDGRSASDTRTYLASPHGLAGVECEDCHGPGSVHVRFVGGFIQNPAEGTFENSYAACTTCHADTVGQFLESQHAKAEVATCHTCHTLHRAYPLLLTHEDNRLCLACHGTLGFETDQAVVAHTFHPNNPAETGASRCTSCHMNPLQRLAQDTGLHNHSLVTRRPIFSYLAIEAGIEPVPPNSCSGIEGCHDGTVPTAPVFNVDDPDQDLALQALVELRYGEQEEDASR